MKRILITGKKSFIGTYFKQHIGEGYEVEEVCLRENPVKLIDFSNYDVVFHVAAIVHQDKNLDDSIYFKVNRDLAVDVAKTAKCAGVSQFVFMSTVKVYGENSTLESPWTEMSKCYPMDAYGKSKLEAECQLQELIDDSFVVSIIRTPVVYGANVKGNILRMAQYVKEHRFIPFGGICNIRAMVYIGNLMAMIYRVVELQKGGLFLANDSKSVSTSEFAQLLIKTSGLRKTLVTIPSLFLFVLKVIMPSMYRRLCGSMVVDNQRTRATLDFVPPYPVEKGIEEVMNSLY